MMRGALRVARREWLLAMTGLVPGAAALRAQQQATPKAEQGAVGDLFNPNVAGRPRDPTAAGDNDAFVRGVEQQLQCTCGCTLDIFTCRTTDFTCTYSPALHREVVALAEAGKSEQELIDAFVAKYGEKVLMAPKPEGFNLAGYVVPGAGILAVGGLIAWILRRRVTRARRPGAEVLTASVPTGAPGASDEELKRLERALEEIDA
jgi:cytochrome c-type biogenesis protein CcmH